MSLRPTHGGVACFIGSAADTAPKFGQVLPPKLVTRFRQIENKLDTLVMLDLVDGIPLMK